MVRVEDIHGRPCLLIGGEEIIQLGRMKRLRILSTGKASVAMLHAWVKQFPVPAGCDVRGVLIAPKRPQEIPEGFEFYAGGHPVPNADSFAGATAALAMMQEAAREVANETLCVFLISGGASSMMELPLDPRLSLDDAIAFNQALVHSGASIVEMNCVRKHFSAVKGGRLGLAAGATTKVSLLVSDVPPAHLDALASGPSLPDPTTVEQCHAVIDRYDLLKRFPEAVRLHFAVGSLAETPKPGAFSSRAWKLLDGDELAEAALQGARKLGFHTVIDNACDDWRYDKAADYLLDRLRVLRRRHPRICLISAGEVTVQVPEEAAAHRSVGGRNQHFALYVATRLGSEDGPVAVLSGGSDGIDGNSDAAGAVVDERTATGSNRDPALQALRKFNSSSWLASLGATIVTGPTGHNLRDLRILLADSTA